MNKETKYDGVAMWVLLLFFTYVVDFFWGEKWTWFFLATLAVVNIVRIKMILQNQYE